MLSNLSKWTLALAMWPFAPSFADTRIATKYLADGETNETMIYTRGERLRYVYKTGESLLRQCDTQRMVQLNEKSKTFLSLKAETPAASAEANPDDQIIVEETGERKEIFGRSARHIRITEKVSGSKTERTEADGWYVDLPDLPSCSNTLVTGKQGPLGFPMAYTIKTLAEKGRTSSTISMEVTDFVVAPLDAALFEVPADYRDNSKLSDSGASAPKASDSTRIGAVPMRNKSGSPNQSTAVYGQLLAELQGPHIDVFPLSEGSDEEIKSKATQAHCDFILYTDLISAQKVVPAGKVGGLLHKTPVVGRATDGDAYEARLDFRLLAVKEGAVGLESSALGKKGHSFNWIGAAQLASNFVPMAMAAKMVGGTGGLSPALLGQLLGTASSGNGMARIDPMMSGMSLFLKGASFSPATKNVPPNPAAMDAAIAAALAQQSKAIRAHLNQ